jgi:hypothetical protein
VPFGIPATEISKRWALTEPVIFFKYGFAPEGGDPAWRAFRIWFIVKV